MICSSCFLEGEEEHDKVSDAAKVLVAVKTAKEIPRTALVWALTHVAQPGDCITLLVLISSQAQCLFRRFPSLGGDCGSRHRRSQSMASAEKKSKINDCYSQMILQLQKVCDARKTNIKVKIISDIPCGAVAAEAKATLANWVVLDSFRCCIKTMGKNQLLFLTGSYSWWRCCGKKMRS